MDTTHAAIFPDTNVFLHFRRLTEIDWCALFNAKTVTIVIAPVVTGELQEQKTLNSSRKLPKALMSKLKAMLVKRGKGGFQIHFERMMSKRSSKIFAADQLHAQSWSRPCLYLLVSHQRAYDRNRPNGIGRAFYVRTRRCRHISGN